MAAIGRVLLMQKGDYSGTTIYNSLDWVRDNGAAWVCKVDGTVGVAPPTLPATSNANWQLLAADGTVSGSINWSSVTNKPFKTVGSGLSVDALEALNLDMSALTASNISYDNSGTGMAATNIQLAIDELYASGGGGGSSTLAGLTDVNLTTPSNNQILKYDSNSSKWVNGTGGGHTMVANTPEADMIDEIANATSSNDKVVSAYGIQKWTNCEAKNILVSINQGTSQVGVWNDNWKSESPAVRTGWIWHKELYRVLKDANNNDVTDIRIDPIFLAADDEVVNLYGVRIDDDYTYNGEHGGCVAFKLNGKIQSASGAKVGVQLTHLRTEDFVGTIIT